MSNVYKELSRIQKELKAPKDRKNSFGKYSYRNAEDILEAVKPLLGGCYILINDEIQSINDRYYVKATAVLGLDDSSVSNCAYAREAEVKKGMDDAQITGSASSYARKYALNGLFAIDDSKYDPDTTNTGQVDTYKAVKKMATKEQVKYLNDLIKLKELSADIMSKWLTKAGVNSFSDMYYDDIQNCIDYLKSQ